MGMNPRYSLWSDENWRGYAPTIGHIYDRGWRMWAICPHCGLAIDLDPAKLMRRKGRDWSPWGVTSPCIRRHCFGAMAWRAANGRAERDIFLSG